MAIEGWTLEELAKAIGMSRDSTRMRIKYRKITPLYTGSIYPPDTLDKIKEAKVGRPPKKPADGEGDA